MVSIFGNATQEISEQIVNEVAESSVVTEEVSEEIIIKDYVMVYVGGNVERTGYFKVPSNWTIGELFDYVKVRYNANINDFDLNMTVEDNKTYYVGNVLLNDVLFGEKVNINTATIKELDDLDGIGEYLALNIISYRQASPFKTIEEIKNVKGIGDKVYEKIKDFITV
jgi:competence protein ComEA